MDIFVARQPIFDCRLKTYGYELLFRDGLDNVFPDIDGDTASSRVLSSSFLGMGVEKLTGGRKAFVNFTPNLLLKRLPRLFSPDILISELLEDIEPESDILAAVAQMRREGCHFALDDFVFHEKLEPLMEFAEIIKVDIRQTSLEEARRLIDRLKGRPIRFLAEKVETMDEYRQTRDMGFSYFQGYFFSKPEIVSRRSIAPGKLRLLQIVMELNGEEPDVGRLEELIKTDISLSYRLLQYMNSAFYNFPRKITSIREAIIFLGLTEVRKIVTLLATANLADSKPGELIRASVIRARLCELVGKAGGYGDDCSELFLLGLFSLMDAILDADMGQLMGQLPLSDRLKTALVNKKGDLSEFLTLITCYERGLWNACPGLSDSCHPMKVTVETYAEAIGWADVFLK